MEASAHVLISTIAVSLAYALVGGFIAAKLRLSPIVGYLVAGLAVGPFTPGFVADTALAHELAEIGVILLMFGVGLHFSVGDLLAVRRIAVPGAVAQIAVATALGMALAEYWNWPLGQAIIFGLALAVASTVVLLRALNDLDAVETPEGRIAVGWLIVEDLVMVLVLVLLPALAIPLGGVASGEEEGTLLMTLAVTFAEVVGFVVVMSVVVARVLPWILDQVAQTGSRELFTLAAIAAALGIAFAATELFGVSYALGAFFAGVVVNASNHRERVHRDTQPLQDAFGILFFVAVGMLLDPAKMASHPWHVAAVVAIIMIGKSLVALAIILLFRYPLRTGLVVAASLAQIGEFSFILVALGQDLGLMTEEGLNLIVSGALISIALNPFLFRLIQRLGAGKPVPA